MELLGQQVEVYGSTARGALGAAGIQTAGLAIWWLCIQLLQDSNRRI
jgi:hypothetical protein